MIINSSPLIIFGKLNRIDILKEIYPKLHISTEVYNEVVRAGLKIKAKESIIIQECIDNNEIKVIDVRDKNKTKKIQLIYNIDIGEAATIALTLQLNEKEVIIDEVSARHAANAFNVKPIGSLRVLLIAYKKNLINKEEVNNLIKEMVNSKYRFSTQVLIEFWSLFDKIKK